MTSPLADPNWRDRHHDEPRAHVGPSDWSHGAVRTAQLQGVVMAVYGVSAAAAGRELRWHSGRLNTSVADHAEGVMSSISDRREAVTPEILGALLVGQPPPRTERGSDLDRRHPARPFASALHLVDLDQSPPAPDAQQRWAWEREGLSRRESQVLRLIGEGLSNQDIAATTFLTINTVKSYIRTAYQKIGITTRAQAVRWALVHEPATGPVPGRPTVTTAPFCTGAESGK